jgi:hypothetical protein
VRPIAHIRGHASGTVRSRLEVGRSKTAAGLRAIDLMPMPHDILAE